MQREITAQSDGVRLAGTAWVLDGADVGVLMHPGSGPSDRNNDVYFPPIREHLLAAGIAVCSFDKRGVGGSSGHWEEAGIAAQADDLLAGLAAFREVADLAIGLFGHSQGGWVVVEAAAREPSVAFAIPSSGGSVSPARQERYSLQRRLPGDDEALAAYDTVVAVMREHLSFDDALERLDEAGVERGRFGELAVMFEDEAIWRFAADLMDYDPAEALGRITSPVLAVFGAEDVITPVEESVAAFRSAMRPELLEVEVFPGGDHRLGHPDFVAGYLDRLSSFIRAAA
jgi:uncharacterized protein